MKTTPILAAKMLFQYDTRLVSLTAKRCGPHD